MSEEIKNIIKEIQDSDKQLKDMDIRILIDYETGYAYKIAEFSNKEDVKTNQLRKFFESIKRIEKSNKDWEDKKVEFNLLKPRLAMAVGRKHIPKEFFDFILALMDKVDVDGEDNTENFNRFVNVYESIIAYHKFLGGK